MASNLVLRFRTWAHALAGHCVWLVGQARRRRQISPAAWFALGVFLIAYFTGTMWSVHWTVASASLNIVQKTSERLPYDCIGPECAECLTGIDKYSNAHVLTGGSGAAYGFDIETIRKAADRPVVNCILYGTWLDGFPLLFNQRNKLFETQDILHAFNSWVPVSGGHLANYDLDKSPYFYPVGYAPSATTVRADLRYLYPILLRRHFSELQVRWRYWLPTWESVMPASWAARWTRITGAIAILPLNLQTHLELKEGLMKRHIKMSPWAASFLQKVDNVPTLEDLRHRLNRVRNQFNPANPVVFFDMPELVAITNAQRDEIFATAKDRFLTVLAELGMAYVPVDYRACGLGLMDFWSRAFTLDPVHPGPEAKSKITKCMLEALKKRNVL